MKISCQACSTQYTIAEDKVRGRKIKIRCKACGQPIVVDAQEPGAKEQDAEAVSVPAHEAEGAIQSNVTWTVNLTETDSRTMNVDEIVAGWKAGIITADAYLWKDGMSDWVPILESELVRLLSPAMQTAPGLQPPEASAFTGSAAVSPVSPAPAATVSVDPAVRAGVSAPALAAPAPVVQPSLNAPGTAAFGGAKSAVRQTVAFGGARASGSNGRATGATAALATGARAPQVAQDLFGAVDVAGSEHDGVTTSARSGPQPKPQQQPQPPPDDARLTGARNENSVLFSLDSLKAGFQGSGPSQSRPPPSAPRPPSPSSRPPPPPPQDDPFGMTSAQLAGLGGSSAGAMFGLADNQALLTAPPKPVPPPVVAQPTPPVADRVSSAEKALAAARRTRDILIGALAGVVVMGITLGIVLSTMSSKKAPAASASAAVPPSKASAQAAVEKVAAKTEETQKAAEPGDKAEEKDTSEADKDKSDKVDEKKADESKSESSSSKRSEPVRRTVTSTASKPKEDSSSSEQPFSKAAAISALTAAAGAVPSCKQAGGPTGSGKVTLTFAPSGRVTTATVNGPPFSGTPVGGCVASVFRRARVPAFSGSPVTVSKSFTIF